MLREVFIFGLNAQYERCGDPGLTNAQWSANAALKISARDAHIANAPVVAQRGHSKNRSYEGT